MTFQNRKTRKRSINRTPAQQRVAAAWAPLKGGLKPVDDFCGGDLPEHLQKFDEMQMTYDREMFEKNPDLESFFRPPFPGEIPDAIAQGFADHGSEVALIEVFNYAPGVRLKNYILGPIQAKGAA